MIANSETAVHISGFEFKQGSSGKLSGGFYDSKKQAN
jgi:hypothetical protein